VLDVALLNGAVASISYRIGAHGALRVKHYEVGGSAPATLARPLTVAFGSDFHAGPTTHPAIFEQLADALRRRAPDVLLLGGDYVSCKPQYLSILLPFLTHYRPPLGIYAVLGNHDIWAGAAAIRRRLETAGIEVLVNRHIRLAPPFDSIGISGSTILGLVGQTWREPSTARRRSEYFSLIHPTRFCYWAMNVSAWRSPATLTVDRLLLPTAPPLSVRAALWRERTVAVVSNFPAMVP